MNKKELARNLAKKFELPINKTDSIISATLETVTKTLSKGEDAAFVGFGTFSVKKRAARTGRNPQTGKTIKISARKVVRFSVSKALKNAVNKK